MHEVDLSNIGSHGRRHWYFIIHFGGDWSLNISTHTTVYQYFNILIMNIKTQKNCLSQTLLALRYLHNIQHYTMISNLHMITFVLYMYIEISSSSRKTYHSYFSSEMQFYEIKYLWRVFFKTLFPQEYLIS